MSNTSVAGRLAVCSWSLQPGTPAELLERLRQTGVSRVQLALDPLREAVAIWDDAVEHLRAHGLEVISGMMGCVGEDYTTLESIRLTGGIVSDGTWEQNLKNARATALLARQLGLPLVTFHAGFVPHEGSDPAYRKMLKRLGTVADVFAAEGIILGLETGQETAVSLLQLLGSLDRPGLGVNFDPANMILYDKGNPIEALTTLGKHIRQVHIKDAKRTRAPGTWGEEVPAGSGEVDWPAFFAALEKAGFKGDFVIEREAGSQRIQDIRAAREMVERVANVE
jgi:L-ribulose-5-phosphate 3-epimerase